MTCHVGYWQHFGDVNRCCATRPLSGVIQTLGRRRSRAEFDPKRSFVGLIYRAAASP